MIDRVTKRRRSSTNGAAASPIAGETQEPLYGDALSAVLAHAVMRALSGDKRELYARVAHLDGTVVVDAGGESWGA